MSMAASKMETKLQQVWGIDSQKFCTRCGKPAVVSDCDGAVAALWSELNAHQKMAVRRQTIRRAKAERSTRTVVTVAS